MLPHPMGITNDMLGDDHSKKNKKLKTEF